MGKSVLFRRGEREVEGGGPGKGQKVLSKLSKIASFVEKTTSQ